MAAISTVMPEAGTSLIVRKEAPHTVQDIVSADVLKWMLTYLEFADLRSLSVVSSTWAPFFRDRTLYERIATSRWPYSGPNEAFRFTVKELDDWRTPCLFRERFLDALSGLDDKSKGEFMCNELVRFRSRTAYREILRLMVELDDQGVDVPSKRCTSMQLNKLVAIFLATPREADGLLHLLSCRVMGLLSVQEENREVLLGALPELVHRVRQHSADSEFLLEALWSLVILCRPRGGAEGRPFHDDGMWQFRAAHIVSENEGISSLLELIEDHREDPLILSRIFWLLVNLCLCPRTKQALQDLEVVPLLIAAMRRFPEHEELQHRAIFALINLCVTAQPMKQRIFETGVVQLMFKAMDNFPASEEIHRYSCCVVRALRHNNDSMRWRLLRLGVVPRIEAMMHHFPDAHLLRGTARQTLTLLRSSDAELRHEHD